MRLQPAPEAGDHLGMFDRVLEAEVGIADQLAAGMQVRPGEQADEGAVLPRDQRVMHDGRCGRDRIGAQ